MSDDNKAPRLVHGALPSALPIFSAQPIPAALIYARWTLLVAKSGTIAYCGSFSKLMQPS